MLLQTIITLVLAVCTYCYIQVPLIRSTNPDNSLTYTFPMKVNDNPYNIAVSLAQTQEYLRPVAPKAANKKTKPNKDRKNPNYAFGVLQATSLESYTVEGWKRFFLEALLFVEQRYKHQFQLELDWLPKNSNISNKKVDGQLSLGPDLDNNKFYTEIKKNTDLIDDDIVGIYIAVDDRHHTLQFGGYETQYFQYRKKMFYTNISLGVSADNKSWTVPANRLMFGKEENYSWKDYTLLSAPRSFKLDMSSQYLVIRQEIVQNLQRSLESYSITCKMEDKLSCQNISSIELSLNFFVIQVEGPAYINVSLYRVLDHCDDKMRKCTFNIKLGDDYSLGEYFFRDYYAAIDMRNPSMVFGVCNKYPTSWFSTVYVLRFLVLFLLFVVAAGLVVAAPDVYQKYRTNRKRRVGLEGIELVPGRSKDQEQDRLDI